ncbi:MAG: type II secretion system protein [Planctomycetota bacterium]
MHCYSITHSGGQKAVRFRQRGFTLIELTVVIVVMGILAVGTISFGYMAFRDKEQLKDEARSLAGYLENIRGLSAHSGKTHTVVYDLDQQMYFTWVPAKNPDEGEILEDGDESDLRKAAGYHRMPNRFNARREREFNVWIDHIAFADGSTADDKKVLIDFSPEGGGHWHYVYLSSDKDNTGDEKFFYTIEVNPFTGAAEIYPGIVEPEEPEKAEPIG